MVDQPTTQTEVQADFEKLRSFLEGVDGVDGGGFSWDSSRALEALASLRSSYEQMERERDEAYKDGQLSVLRREARTVRDEDYEQLVADLRNLQQDRIDLMDTIVTLLEQEEAVIRLIDDFEKRGGDHDINHFLDDLRKALNTGGPWDDVTWTPSRITWDLKPEDLRDPLDPDKDMAGHTFIPDAQKGDT